MEIRAIEEMLERMAMATKRAFYDEEPWVGMVQAALRELVEAGKGIPTELKTVPELKDFVGAYVLDITELEL